jgi:hypothetical protein
MREINIGYDARVPVHELQAFETDRLDFLIRPEINQVISIDRLVWPGMIGERVDHPFGLWNDLGELVRLNSCVRERQVAIIAISIVIDSVIPVELESAIGGNAAVEPGAFAEHAQFLGFDIGDRALISAVSNCLLYPHEMLDMRAKYATHLNDHGLFIALEAALNAKADYEGLIPEHSPLFAFRVRELQLR